MARAARTSRHAKTNGRGGRTGSGQKKGESEKRWLVRPPARKSRMGSPPAAVGKRLLEERTTEKKNREM